MTLKVNQNLSEILILFNVNYHNWFSKGCMFQKDHLWNSMHAHFLEGTFKKYLKTIALNLLWGIWENKLHCLTTQLTANHSHILNQAKFHWNWEKENSNIYEFGSFPEEICYLVICTEIHQQTFLQVPHFFPSCHYQVTQYLGFLRHPQPQPISWYYSKAHFTISYLQEQYLSPHICNNLVRIILC